MNDEGLALYKKLCKENNIARKKYILPIVIVATLLLILLAIINIIFFMIVFYICIVTMIIIYSTKQTKNIEDKYKTKVIYPLLKQNISGIEYSLTGGMTRNEYNNTALPNGGDTYNIKEYISIPFKGSSINITHIEIYDRSSDDNYFVFGGFVSEFNIPKQLIKDVKVLYNAFNLIKTENNIPIDNVKFDEKYDILCEDINYAMRMFTQDVMLQIMELHAKYKKIVDISICGNKVYMRSRQEVGINDYLSYTYKDIENKIKSISFIEKMADIIYNMIENFEN